MWKLTLSGFLSTMFGTNYSIKFEHVADSWLFYNFVLGFVLVKYTKQSPFLFKENFVAKVKTWQLKV